MPRSTIAAASAVILSASTTSIVVVNAQTPTKTPTKTPTVSPTDSPTKNFYYPGWGTDKYNTCVSTTTAGTPAKYINDNTAFRSHDTLEKCCEYSFLGTYNQCIIEGGGTLVATDEWYIDYSDHTNHKCSKDCAVSTSDLACNGILGKFGNAKFHATAELCCSEHLSYIKEDYCVDVSNRVEPQGTGKWYVRWDEYVCVKDCPAGGSDPECFEVIDEASRTLYNDVQTCCSQGLPGVTTEYCVAQTNPNNATNMWFLSTEATDHCKKDCIGSSDICAAAGPYDKVYDSAKKCCDAKLGWVKDPYCVTRSEKDPPYTGRWFVSSSYSNTFCVKDCQPGTEDSCSDDLGPSDPTFDTPALCCGAKLDWINPEKCEASSIAGSVEDMAPTNKFYADYADAKRCVQDCDTVGGNPACKRLSEDYVTLYDDAAKCCTGKFGWYDQPLCVAISNTGVTETERWYAVYDHDVESCVQDCDTETATCVKPGGQPNDFSQATYDELGKCCTAKIGWDVDGCKCRADPTLTECQGDGKYYAPDEGDTNICVKNCPTDSSDPECGGVSTYERPYFDTIEKCCEQTRFNGQTDIEKCECEGKDPTDTIACPAAAGSGKWYSTDNHCKKDCPESQGSYCQLAPPGTIYFYDSSSACCSTPEFAWTTEDNCLGTTS